MPLLTDDDRLEFRIWVRDGLQQHAPLAMTRELAESGRRDDPSLCGSLADLGLFGLSTPEAYGGGDVGAAGLAIFLMEAGRCLLPAPYLSTAVLAPTAIRWAGAEEHFADLLKGIAAGQARVALTVSPSDRAAPPRAMRDGHTWRLTGAVPAVLEADVADWLIVAAETDTGPGVFMVDVHGAGVHIAALQSVDTTRPVASVTFASAPGVALCDHDSAAALRARLQDLVRLAIAADAVGGAQRLLDMSVEYAKTRVQFGRPIGSFQSIKHRCADLFVAVQAATAAVEAAFDHLEQRQPAIPVAVAAVCAHEANWQAVRTAMQIHGGLALTWEHEVQLYLKRATASQHLLGNPDRELVRLTDLVLAEDYDLVREIIG